MSSWASDPGTGAVVRCPACGNEVPELDFCVRCGNPLAAGRQGRARLGRRAQYAAQPEEQALGVHIVSTLFPRLPRKDMATFAGLLLVGTVAIVGLAVSGFFPIALVAALVAVPVLQIMYVWHVDAYGDEPLLVIGFTVAWGIVTGIAVGYFVRVLPGDTSVLGLASAPGLWIRGVAVPLVGGGLMLAGPLLLLPNPKFNSVLDGTAFGVTSAATFTLAEGLSASLPLFAGGIHPVGDPLPWVVRLLSLGVATPLIAAGVIGATTGAFWLRYRSPVGNRGQLGLAGQPFAATAVAGVTLVGAAAGQQLLPFVPAALWLAVLAIGAMIWLRAVIHVGLLQESGGSAGGPPIRCPDCGRMTPAGAFCGHCGTSLRATPNGPPTGVSVAGPAAPTTAEQPQ